MSNYKAPMDSNPYEDHYPKWYPDDSHLGFQQWDEPGYEEE